MNKELKEFLSGMSEGDVNALSEIYDLMAAKIYNYVISITQKRQMSEDITHDVFLQILKHADRILRSSNPYGYIMAMARNQAYNVLKRERRIISMGDIPDTAVEESCENAFMLEEAFDILPANQREVVYLHLVCGFTHKETAKIQNAPLVTVKWRYSKALATLRNSLAENEGGCLNDPI